MKTECTKLESQQNVRVALNRGTDGGGEHDI